MSHASSRASRSGPRHLQRWLRVRSPPPDRDSSRSCGDCGDGSDRTGRPHPAVHAGLRAQRHDRFSALLTAVSAGATSNPSLTLWQRSTVVVRGSWRFADGRSDRACDRDPAARCATFVQRVVRLSTLAGPVPARSRGGHSYRSGPSSGVDSRSAPESSLRAYSVSTSSCGAWQASRPSRSTTPRSGSRLFASSGRCDRGGPARAAGVGRPPARSRVAPC